MGHHRVWAVALVFLLSIASVAQAAAPNVGQEPPAPNLGPNQFNTAPAGQLTGKPNASVMVHGWTSAPTYWANDLRGSIDSKLGSGNDWDIWAFDWTQGASDSRHPLLQDGPTQANEISAVLQGQYLAKTLVDGNYQNVHLYGHSLGGRVIETASDILRQAKPNLPIQATFLDAYTPYIWDKHYGSSATWAEHIVNTGTGGGDTGPYTQNFFEHAYNIDVTAPRPPKPANWPSDVSYGHNWPRVWYRNTVDNYIADAPKYANLGWPLAMEFDLAQWPQAVSTHPKGKRENFTANEDTLGPSGTAPGSFIRNVSTLDLNSDFAAIVGKSSDNVYIDQLDNTLTIHADPNIVEWCHLEYTTSDQADYLELEFNFQTAGSSQLSVYWDNDLVWAAREEFALTSTWEKTGKISWRSSAFNLQPGTHYLSYRLDPSSAAATDVKLQNITIGLLVAPEPGCGVLLVMVIAVTALRRSQRRRIAADDADAVRL